MPCGYRNWKDLLRDTAWTIALLGVVWIIAFALTGDAEKAAFWMGAYAIVGLLGLLMTA